MNGTKVLLTGICLLGMVFTGIGVVMLSGLAWGLIWMGVLMIASAAIVAAAKFGGGDIRFM